MSANELLIAGKIYKNTAASFAVRQRSARLGCSQNIAQQLRAQAAVYFAKYKAENYCSAGSMQNNFCCINRNYLVLRSKSADYWDEKLYTAVNITTCIIIKQS